MHRVKWFSASTQFYKYTCTVHVIYFELLQLIALCACIRKKINLILYRGKKLGLQIRVEENTKGQMFCSPELLHYYYIITLDKIHVDGTQG